MKLQYKYKKIRFHSVKCEESSLCLTIMAIFTLLHIDRSSLGDRTVLLSEVQKQ